MAREITGVAAVVVSYNRRDLLRQCLLARKELDEKSYRKAARYALSAARSAPFSPKIYSIILKGIFRGRMFRATSSITKGV